MTARSSSHPPPRNTVELHRRNTSPTAQKTVGGPWRQHRGLRDDMKKIKNLNVYSAQ